MNDYIETPTMGEILKEEFMIPMGLSSYKLAHEIHVPVSRIQAILNSGRKITPDTSLRLARFFGVSDRYFLNIQDDLDIRQLKSSMKDEISEIRPYQYSSV
jgi:antitoxin HigA-1